MFFRVSACLSCVFSPPSYFLFLFSFYLLTHAVVVTPFCSLILCQDLSSLSDIMCVRVDRSSVHPFFRSFVRSFAHSLVCSFIRSLMGICGCVGVCACVYVCVCVCVCLCMCVCVCD